MIETESIFPRAGQREHSSPPNREGPLGNARGGFGGVPIELDLGIDARQDGFARKICVAKILCLQSFRFGIAFRMKHRPRHFDGKVRNVRRTLGINHFGFAAELLDHPIERQHRVHRGAIVIALERPERFGIRADDGDRFHGALQREETVGVLEQNHRFPGHLERRHSTLRRADFR